MGFVDLQLDKFGHKSIGLSFTGLSALSSLLLATHQVASLYLASSFGFNKIVGLLNFVLCTNFI